MYSPSTLKDRLDYIQGKIQKAAISSGRKQKQITLVAITKKFPVEIWKRAVNVNLTTLGESRIQETQKKVETFRERDEGLSNFFTDVFLRHHTASTPYSGEKIRNFFII